MAGCAPCAARRAQLAAAKMKYVWTPGEDSPEGLEPMEYDTEIKARAKVMRKGGSYVAVSAGS